MYQVEPIHRMEKIGLEIRKHIFDLIRNGYHPIVLDDFEPGRNLLDHFLG